MTKMDFKRVFEVFSRRNVLEEPPDVPKSFRNKILMRCAEVFGIEGRTYYSITPNEFWKEIQRTLKFRHGTFLLSNNPDNAHSPMNDVVQFLDGCKGEHFLDFIEDIFTVRKFFQAQSSANELVKDINTFLSVDNIPFFLTNQATKEVITESGGRNFSSTEITAFPKIVQNENPLAFSIVIEPVLLLLEDPIFASANEEFLEALIDYKKGDYRNALTKCGSALESVLKILHKMKKWNYKEIDTASTLINSFIQNSSLDSFYEQPLMIVATLRNRYSKAHGAGSEDKKVNPYIAQFCINATASAIILVINEVAA